MEFKYAVIAPSNSKMALLGLCWSLYKRPLFSSWLGHEKFASVKGQTLPTNETINVGLFIFAILMNKIEDWI